jgi:Inner membrane component of T3SS, cytoplasmic domain
MAEERKRLVISAEDLPPDPSDKQHAGIEAGDAATEVMGAPLPSIEGVRPQARPVAVGGPSLSFGGTLPNNVAAAAVAALAGWAAFRLFFAHPEPTTDLVGLVAKEVGLFGAVFAAVFAAWEDARSGVWEAAARSALAGLLLGAIAGAASGAVAQLIFEQLVENILEDSGSIVNLVEKYSSAEFYLTRALAWAIFGAGVGISLGVAKRSSRKTLNAAIGGVIGGALGGLVFHYASIHVQDESMSQLIGFGVVGLGIGVAIGLVEVARRQAWLKVVRGGMLGKEFIVYHQVTNVGSAPKCEITLIKDPQVSPFHCRVDDRGGRYSITAYEGSQVSINGTPVTSHWLRAGDAVEVGGTTLQYQERQAR